MKWYIKQRTLGWIALLIGLVLWGQLNRWSCIIDNGRPSIADRVTRTSESVTYIRNRTKNILETLQYLKEQVAGGPTTEKGYLTIGIPTVRRQGVDYLEWTLRSLITHSTPSQQKLMVVIIFMVDRDQAWVQRRSKQLSGKYPKYIDSGFLQIVHQHDQSIYPDFSKLKRTYNDSAERVEWRSKQNIDYAYLFAYSENISKYYLHIEDDVIAASNYYAETVNFIEHKSHTFWYYMELSHIGFIGKVLRSSDLRDLSDYMMLFFAEQPCDLLLLALGQIKTQTKRIRIVKSLFQHIGTVSSQKGKEQKIIDRFFKDSLISQKSNYQKKFNHINPSAHISTDIEVYTIHKPVYAYDLTDKYFCGVSPRKGSYFRVVFDAPQNISHVYVHTGTGNKEPDILHYADLVVSASNGRPCQNTTHITTFTSGGVDTKNSNITFPPNINCLAIEITANHTGWVIIREIAVFLPGEMETKEPKYETQSVTNREAVYPIQYPVKHLDKPANYDSSGIQICPPKQFHHANPHAAIYTQIETYYDYKAVHAYDTSTESYFWGPPSAGDFFLIMLDNSQNISRIFIDTGCYGKESDIFYDARLLVSLRPPAEKERVGAKCQKLDEIGTFQNGDIDIKIPKNYTYIDCIVIEVMTDQSNWVIIREIAIFLSREKGDKKVQSTHTQFKSAMLKENILSTVETSKPRSKTSIWSVNNSDQVMLSSQRQRYVTTTYPRQERERFHKPHNIHVINKDRSSNTIRGEMNISMGTQHHASYNPTMFSRTKNAENDHLPTASTRMKYGDSKILGATYRGSNNLNTAPPFADADKRFENRENVNNFKAITRVPAISRRFNNTSKHLNGQKNERELKYNVKVDTKPKGITSKKMVHHENPGAALYTSIQTFSGYMPKYAYGQSEKYFWGTSPKRGDYFRMLLNVPQNITRIFIDSGHVERQSDILQNARLLVSARTSGDQVKPCQTLQWVANFVNGDVDTKASNISLPLNIDCIVIEVTADHYNWVIIREIAVFSLGEKDIISAGRKARHLPAQRNNVMEMQVSKEGKETLKLTSPFQGQYITGKQITREKESARIQLPLQRAKQGKSKHPERRKEGRSRL